MAAVRLVFGVQLLPFAYWLLECCSDHAGRRCRVHSVTYTPGAHSPYKASAGCSIIRLLLWLSQDQCKRCPVKARPGPSAPRCADCCRSRISLTCWWRVCGSTGLVGSSAPGKQTMFERNCQQCKLCLPTCRQVTLTPRADSRSGSQADSSLAGSSDAAKPPSVAGSGFTLAAPPIPGTRQPLQSSAHEYNGRRASPFQPVAEEATTTSGSGRGDSR